jgi:Ca2+-binding RTX toxin-like protein
VDGVITAGTHKLLRFDFASYNAGNKDLDVGRPEDNPDLFVFSSGHGHYHLSDFNNYTLFDSQGRKVGDSYKQAFCLMDTTRVGSSADPSAFYTCDYQGISAGWADWYQSTLPGQYIAIDGLRNGNYRLQVTTDYKNYFQEDLENDNAMSIGLNINGNKVTWIAPFWGGGGNDKLTGSDLADKLRGEGGNDTINGLAGNDYLDGGSGNDKLYGGTGNDKLYGGSGSDHLNGGTGNDSLYGSSGDDHLDGGTGHDKLDGGSSNDRLSGGSGNDKLTGGSGADVFVFDAKLGTDRKVNFDKVADFNAKADSFWLDNAVFKKLGSKGSEDHPAKLKKAFFTIGDHARDKNDYLIYDSKRGVLSYDADGSGAKAAVEFAALKKGLKLSYHDVFVM